jgi:hypothetical protein
MGAHLVGHSNIDCSSGALTLPKQYVGNPAVDFLKEAHLGGPDAIIQGYAQFLLHTSGAYRLPVPLSRVHRYFGFPVHHHRLAADQQGFTTEDLSIYVNSEDWPTRQKFTLAHELMEVLFTCFATLCDDKERYCNKGAAELIMPLPLFQDVVGLRPISLEWAQEVAERCRVSLKATLCRMIETGLTPTVLIIWHCKNSPRELRSQPSMRTNQGGKGTIPPKKMRVAGVFSPPGFAYIPPDKSVAPGSSIHQTYIDGFPKSAEEELDLVGLRGRYLVESRAFVAGGERRVMSLIHLRRQ